jgi:phosphatidylserine/phosphatidylglycerophosphate/cardiolipin synthase-like enzyme
VAGRVFTVVVGGLVAAWLAGCRNTPARVGDGPAQSTTTSKREVAETPAPASRPAWNAYFSPNGGAEAAIIRGLDDARQSVLAQAYSFTSAPIAKALVAAHRRGVQVEVILDKSQRTERYSGADFLVNSGVATHIDSAHAIAHNKVMVIDGRVVLTGSFNFTRGAEERNAENLLVVQDGQLAELYARNWRLHLEHAKRYPGRSGAAPDAPRPRGRRERAH